jgi:hypothetical protein
MTLNDNKISAVDLSQVIVVKSINSFEGKYLSDEDLEYQESRKKRKVRKMEFEIK